MDALKFFKEFKRMCNCYSEEFCAGCPRKVEPNCDELIMEDDELNKLIADVEKWSKEHPLRTRLQDFLEKYPNAPVDGNGTPQACCEHLGYCTKSCDPFELTCKDCWDIPIGDDE